MVEIFIYCKIKISNIFYYVRELLEKNTEYYNLL